MTYSKSLSANWVSSGALNRTTFYKLAGILKLVGLTLGQGMFFSNAVQGLILAYNTGIAIVQSFVSSLGGGD